MARSTGNSSLKRRLQILDVVRQQMDVKVETLSQQFGVSTVTIRSDLNYLEEQGFIVRSFGGARYNAGLQAQQAFSIAHDRCPPIRKAEEIQVARLAAEMVEDGDTILLGAGRLIHKMVPFLATRTNLFVIVNDLEIVPTIRQFLDCDLHLLGGTVTEDCPALVGPSAEQAVRMQAVSKCFLEFTRVNPTGMLTYTNAAMARLYRSIVEHAQLSIALASRIEFPVIEGYPVCGVNELSHIIVHRDLEDQELEVLYQGRAAKTRASGDVQILTSVPEMKDRRTFTTE